MPHSSAKIDAIEAADAELQNVNLPTYNELLDALLAQFDAETVSERRAANKTARDLLIKAGVFAS